MTPFSPLCYKKHLRPLRVNHPVITFEGSGCNKRKREYNLCKESAAL